MKKFFFFAMFVATAMTCSANNESENVENAAEPETTEIAAEAPEPNMLDEVFATIDPTVSSRFYVNEERQLFLVELGERFIRVRDFQTQKIVYTISKYLSEENGTWVNGADCVMQYQGQFLPAKRILTGKGIRYKAAKHCQYVPMNRVRSVEREYQIWL